MTRCSRQWTLLNILARCRLMHCLLHHLLVRRQALRHHWLHRRFFHGLLYHLLRRLLHGSLNWTCCEVSRISARPKHSWVSLCKSVYGSNIMRTTRSPIHHLNVRTTILSSIHWHIVLLSLHLTRLEIIWVSKLSLALDCCGSKLSLICLLNCCRLTETWSAKIWLDLLRKLL